MLDQVYSTNGKNLYCSVVILFFFCFEGLYESPDLFWVRSRGEHSIERLLGKAW